jgi:hypothetical protein
MPETHVQLHVHGGKGLEHVHAEPVGDRRYRVLSSPGFVLGVAAGDEIELAGEDGQFRVLQHGGNLAVQLFSKEPVRAFRESLGAKVRDSLKGVLDGGIERGLVFTIPIETGFDVVEAFFDGVVREIPGTEWMYGNVYDPETGSPLGWWTSPSADADQDGSGGIKPGGA